MLAMIQMYLGLLSQNPLCASFCGRYKDEENSESSGPRRVMVQLSVIGARMSFCAQKNEVQRQEGLILP